MKGIKSRALKSLLTFIVAFTMILSAPAATFANSAAAADDQTTGGQTQEQASQTDDQSSASQAQDVQKDQSAGSDQVQDSTKSDSGSSTSGSSAKNENAKSGSPAATLTDIAGGARITVEAPAGALPEGTSMTARAVNNENAVDTAVSETLGENQILRSSAAFDITFYDVNGKKIEPDRDVSVNIAGTDLKGENFSLYHMSSINSSAKKVNGMVTNGSTNFKADDFSIYVIAGYNNKTSSTYTLTFNRNGGSIAAPAAVSSVKEGDEVTLPGYSGTKAKCTFIGWSTDKDANAEGSGHYTKAVYPKDSVYTMGNANTTLYAVWASSEAVDAQFFIRLDGKIPTEPQGHAVSEYTGAINISGAIKGGYAYFYTNSTSGVDSHLTTVPTAAQIKAVYSKYDSESQYVLWYVVKHESTWHIDGVLLDKAKVNLSYDPNAPAGTWSNMPDGQQYAVGATATVSSKVPVRSGYSFTGWNTEADGSGTSYAGNATFKIEKATTLYAQWKPNDKTAYKVNYYYQKENGSYSETADKTMTRYGATDAVVKVTDADKKAAPKGYVLDNDAAGKVYEAAVNGDGSTVLKVYFKKQIALTITADSSSKTYDGTALTDSGYSMTAGTLAAGDEIASVAVTGSQTNAGSSDNTAASAVIMHGDNDVTANYDITYADGSLTVSPVVIELTADSSSKTYDGTALTDSGYSITGGAFVDNDGLSSVTVEGSQTFAGSSANTITGYTLAEGTNADNYNIVKKAGTLTVNKASIALTITADSNHKTYDGTALTDSGYSRTAGTLATGDSIASAAVTGSQTNAGSSANTASNAVIKHGDTDVTANYDITYVDGSLTVSPIAIELTANSADKSYDGTALTDDGYQITSGKFAGTDGLANVTVEGSQTLVGSSDNKITGYTLAEGTKADNYSITTKTGTLSVTNDNPIAITITADSSSKTYDGTALTDGGYTYTGTLAKGDTISSVTVAGSQTDAGSSGNVASAAKIMHGDKDVTANYKITYADGSLTVNPVSIELTANSANKSYDGTPLTNSGYSITSGAFVGNEGLSSVTVSGSQIFAGSSANTITGHSLKDGTKAGNYTVTYKPGTLTVTQAVIPITITADSNSKTYDGTALTDGGYTYTGTLANGDTVSSATVAGSQTDAGSSANAASNAVIKHGDTDVTANYKITYANGSLTVNPVAIELTANSSSKTYDGTPLTNSGYSITGGAFVGNEGLSSVTVEGSQTFAGSSANTITGYTLAEGTNADNYNIAKKAGTLTVNKASIALTITADSNSKTYDGTALTDGGYTYTGTLANGDTVSSATVAGSQTDAGSSANAASNAVIKHGDTDVTANYKITYADGSLTVNPISIELTADSSSKTYDGTALTDSGYSITGGAFVDNEGLSSVTVEGSQTFAGSSANTITGYTLAEGTNADNYNIAKKAGTLTVNKASIALTITADSNSKTYDGTALTDGGYTYTGTLANGDTVSSATVAGSQTNAGSSDNIAASAVIKHGGTDVTENYDITYIAGKLSVAPAVLTVTTPDATKAYDETALTAAGSISGFVNGETATFTTTGTQTAVGSSSNTYSLTWDGKAEKDNYKLTEDIGTLTVTEAPGRIDVTKATIVDGKPAAVSHDIFHAALFDSDGNIASDVKEINMDGNTSAEVSFTGLILNKEYKVCETDADGSIINGDPDNGWTIAYDNQTVTLTADRTTGEAAIINDYSSQQDQGSVTVNKTVTVNGKKKAVDNHYYTALFSDEACTNIVTDVKTLDMNGNSSTSVTFLIDKGGNYLGDGTYYVAETDKYGKAITDTGDSSWLISIKGSKVEMTKDDPNKTATITNAYKDGVQPYDPDNPSRSSTETLTSSTKTGDSSNMSIWLMLAVLGLAGAGMAAAGKRRKSDDGQ